MANPVVKIERIDESSAIDSVSTAPVAANAGAALPIRRGPGSSVDGRSRQVSDLTFVTISNPEEAKDSTNRFLVRSQALRDYKAKQRQKKQRNVTSKKEILPGLMSRHNAGQDKDVESRQMIGSKPRLCNCLSTRKTSTLIIHRCGLYFTAGVPNVLQPSPQSLLGAGRVDPFSSYPRPLNYHEQQVLNYFITHYAPANDPLYSTELANALSKIWLPEAVKHQGLLDGMLLITCRDYMQKVPSKELSSLILQLRGKLILDVQEAVRDKRRAANEQSIGTLLQLAFDEIFTGNWKALAAHTKALNLIVQSRSDVPNTDFQKFILYLIARVNLISALNKPSPSGPPSATKLRDMISIENLKLGFLTKDIIDNLSTETLAMLDSYCALSNFLDAVPGAALPPVGSFSIEGAFAENESEGQSRSTDLREDAYILNEPDVEACMVFAAGVYRSQVLYQEFTSDAESEQKAILQMENFISSLSRLFLSPRKSCYLPLLFWLAFMGSLSTIPAPIPLYWSNLMYKIARELRITAWEQAILILKDFLWSGRRCEKHAKTLWEDMEQIAALAGSV